MLIKTLFKLFKLCKPKGFCDIQRLTNTKVENVPGLYCLKTSLTGKVILIITELKPFIAFLGGNFC